MDGHIGTSMPLVPFLPLSAGLHDLWITFPAGIPLIYRLSHQPKRELYLINKTS